MVGLRIAGLAALAALVSGPSAALQEPEPGDVKITADYGWGSRFRPHHWTPVNLVIENRGKATKGRIRLRWAFDSFNQGHRRRRFDALEGGPGTVTVLPVSLPEASRRVHTAYVVASRGDYRLWVTFEPEGGEAPPPTEIIGMPASADVPFVAVVGKSLPSGFHLLAPGTVETAITLPESLPDRWPGYACLDALVWIDGDASRLRDPIQAEALEEWVWMGGRLVVAGSDALGLSRSFLEPMLPVRIRGPAEVARITSIQGVPTGRAAVIESVLKPDAVERAREGSLPLIASRRHGRGLVTFVAFHPDHQPFASGSSRDSVWLSCLALTEPPEESQGALGESDPVALFLGSHALARTAFEFPAFRPPSIEWVFWVLVLYIILIGPVDYFVLRKLKRHEWTWATFPGMVVAFSALTLGAAQFSARRTAVQREMGFLDVVGDRARSLTVGSLLSPLQEEVALEADAPWTATIPVSSGSYGWAGGSEVSTGALIQTDRIAAHGWVLERGDTAVAASVTRPARGDPAVSFTSRPTGESSRVLEVETDVAIPDAALVAPEGLYRAGDLAPGKHSLPLRASKDWKQELLSMFGRSDPGRISSLVGAEERARRASGLLESDEAAQAAAIRRTLVSISFADALVPGPGRFTGSLIHADATDWIREGGTVLIGWIESPSAMRFGDLRARTSSVILLRVFER